MISSLLLHAIAGYWFLLSYRNTKIQTKDAVSYHVLLRAAIAGSVLLLASHFILRGIGYIATEGVSTAQDLMPNLITLEVVASLVLARVTPSILHGLGLVESDHAIISKQAKEASGHVELLALEALEKNTPIEVTLRSRKVYVGYVKSVGVKSSRDGDLTLLPIMSGFRDVDTLDLTLDLVYTSTIQQFTSSPSGLAEDDFRLVVRLTEVITARLFNESVYATFQTVIARGERQLSE